MELRMSSQLIRTTSLEPLVYFTSKSNSYNASAHLRSHALFGSQSWMYFKGLWSQNTVIYDR